MELRRTFSGSLASNAEFLVAPKVSGRVEYMAVDIGDPVLRKQEVARLDNDEYIQAVAQAKADLAVADADLTGAENARDIAKRELSRMETLKNRGVSSASQVDAARAAWLAAKARVETAQARVLKAQAQLETARIRLGYTSVFADWTGGSDTRFMAEKFVTEGDTVSANTPLVSIVELDPLMAVFFVTEKIMAGSTSASGQSFPRMHFRTGLSRGSWPELRRYSSLRPDRPGWKCRFPTRPWISNPGCSFGSPLCWNR